jgi:hypothetical protein
VGSRRRKTPGMVPGAKPVTPALGSPAHSTPNGNRRADGRASRGVRAAFVPARVASKPRGRWDLHAAGRDKDDQCIHRFASPPWWRS